MYSLTHKEDYEGKPRMQNDLDGLLGEVDLNLWDYGLLMKTGSSVSL